jgi:hypothetical protein
VPSTAPSEEPCGTSRFRQRPFAGGSSRATPRSHSAEHHAQIVCGHLGDNRSRESHRLRHRGNRFEVSQTPVRVAIAKAPVECLVARSRCDPFAYVRTVEIKRRRWREYRGGTFEQSEGRLPRRDVDHVEQMTPSADAIGQTECDTSRAMGARTFVPRVVFTHAATLSRASGSGSEGWKTRAGKFLAKWTICSPEPLAISRMTPVIGRTSRRDVLFPPVPITWSTQDRRL